jgi:NADPH-dependent 2,4-dienoyl-CoA reductase/sulfur reductase-like enzyme
MRSVTVVGGSLAGLSSARALRDAGFDGRITVVGDEPHRPYDRPPLSKELLSGRMTPADITLEAEGEDLAVDWRLGVRATALRPADRAVQLSDGTQLRSDGVVLATGARARTLPGTDGPSTTPSPSPTSSGRTALSWSSAPGSSVRRWPRPHTGSGCP